MGVEAVALVMEDAIFTDRPLCALITPKAFEKGSVKIN
jgi:hypothetical protein